MISRPSSLVPVTGSVVPCRFVAFVAPAFFALLLVACGNAADGAAADESEAAVVRTQVVQASDVDVYGTYPGRARGAREVEVRARVDGILASRTYVEGAVVRRNDPLFRISERPYEIAVQRAEALLAEASATANEARREWERVQGLFEQDAVSARERDQSRAAVELADARRQTAAAGLAAARLDLSYTDVRSPIAGVTELETVPEGTLVSPGALLTRVTQLDPIHLRFSFPEVEALRRAERQAATEDEAPPVVLILNDGSEYSQPGEIDFTNAGVDAATGSINARAVFPNPDGLVRPGQFLRIRVLMQSLKGVVRVPETAIGQGKDGTQVFVVEDGKATPVMVTLGPVVEGEQVIIEGLKGGERIVVSGLTGLEEGDAVVEADDTEGDR